MMNRPVYIIQNWAAESPGTIAQYLQENDIEFRTVHAYSNEPLPSINACRAVIILGTPISATRYQEYEFLNKLHSFGTELVKADMPVLGICFGAQLAAMIHGAEVRANHVKEIGIYRVSLTEEGKADPLFDGFEQEFEVFHWHGDTFDIPPGATHLAVGEDCRNQSFRMGTTVGVQFHLEPLIAEIPIWCDEYKSELKTEGKTKDELVTAFAKSADQIRQLNYRLLENFLL